MFSISFRKHREKKELNLQFILIIKMQILFACATLRQHLVLVLCFYRFVEVRLLARSFVQDVFYKYINEQSK